MSLSLKKKTFPGQKLHSTLYQAEVNLNRPAEIWNEKIYQDVLKAFIIKHRDSSALLSGRGTFMFLNITQFTSRDSLRE